VKVAFKYKHYHTRGEEMMENEYLKIAEYVEKGIKVQDLMSKVNADSLIREHKKQCRNKASGVDGVTKGMYEENLNGNIDALVKRMKDFSYKPLPVRRTHIPKEGSDKLRPLGIPAYEDKLVQGAMAEILNAVYEPKFMEFSYGFRPKRDCHKAIFALDKIIMRDSVNYVVDADIKGFFDNVNHEWLIKFLEHDIDDKRFIRYIKRFLKSGIVEEGKYLESDKGTPQGGLISPILANVYLHYVLDLWFEKEVKKQCRYYAGIVRYADDFVCCFQYEGEAKKFLKMLTERLAKFGLELAEEKTKIIPFGRFQRQSKETFDFLGFTHLNGITRKGKYKLVHITSTKKLKTKMQSAKIWLKENMHMKPADIIKKLNVKLNGHYRYYGISDNSQRMDRFRRYCQKRLYRVLYRRSQGGLSWEKFETILKYNPIARPQIYHSTWQSK
jgi:group II intron reverse transcriptase/maturase